ncbi:hypothetical protein AC578_4261 [Pseudocercospora eumusae]|uniref:Uncharacterized protein n=1 Tax=Pseudocercospora eumusae TaxID=321146 RepID=A0A139HAQ0_9PEZI|nr:hypothetical protein AC578_4261 [Pseudocercospora eumusae]
MASTYSQDETYAYEQTEKKVDAPHGQSDVDKVLEERTQQMLESYSVIAPSCTHQVCSMRHIARCPVGSTVRTHPSQQQRAWDIAPYASVGAMTWLKS